MHNHISDKKLRHRVRTNSARIGLAMRTLSRICAATIACLIVLLLFYVISNRKADSRSKGASYSTSPDQNQKWLFTPPMGDDELISRLNGSLDEAQRALAAGEKRLPSRLSSSLDVLYKILYTSLNWDPLTGKLRNDDPYDFADFRSVIQRGSEFNNATSDKLPPHHITFMNLFNGNRLKLDMMIPQEDFSSFVTMVVYSEWMGTPTDNMAIAVRKQMQRGNFEPVAKYLYLHKIGGGLVAPGHGMKSIPQDITFQEVVEAIRAADGVAVSEWTAKAIEMIQRGAVIVEKLAATN